MQAVSASIEWLAVNRNRIAERNRGVLIGSGTPDLAVGNQGVPDFAIVYQRAMIGDCDVGYSDTLGDFRALARARQIQYERLRRADSRHRSNQQAEKYSS